MRTALGILLAASAVAALPGVAAAATQSTVTNDENGNVFKAGAGPANVTIDQNAPEPFAFSVADTGNSLVARGGCSASGASALCPLGSWTVRLGPSDDRLRIFTYYSPATVAAGAGDDVIRHSSQYGTSRAGSGDDAITGNGRSLDLYGDADDDTLYGWEGAVRLNGGGGQDVLLTEPTWYTAGAADGGDGHDLVFAGNYAGPLSGGSGNDIIGFVSEVADVAPISGGAGADLIYGSDLSDTIAGGTGNDEIRVYDGGADTVDCGGGFDKVFIDETDTVSNCERVTIDPGLADPRYEAAKARAISLRPAGLGASL